MTASRDKSAYPIVVVQDRYGGVYSRGKWVAIASADDLEVGGALLADLIDAGTVQHQAIRSLGASPWGSDPSAAEFWSSPPDYVAVGDTPNEAVESLIRKGWVP